MAEPTSIRADELTSITLAAVGLGESARFALEREGVSTAQYRVLALLERGPVIASDLADRLGVTSASVTKMIDRLVEAGMVERRPDTIDRRRVIHELNDEGLAAMSRAEASVERLLGSVAAMASAEEARALLEALPAWGAVLTRRVTQAVEVHDEGALAVALDTAP
jgi:DNA-binding MarR family transcriptional regulator